MSLDPTLFPPIPPVARSAPRPFWSVIVPAYKPDYLDQALRSVLHQDPGRDQMEILVIDDCSPHDLQPIIRAIGGDRLSYIRQSENRGTYPTENAALAMSRGNWIHILNDDDWVLPGFYAAFRSVLENQPSSIGAACCGFIHNRSSGQPMPSPPLLQRSSGVLSNWLGRIAISNLVHPISVVVRRDTYERLGGYHEGLNYCADWEFNKRCATFYDWWYVPEFLACYRINPKSVSLQMGHESQHLRDLARAIDLSDQYLPVDMRAQIKSQSREHYALFALRQAVTALEQENLTSALECIKEGFGLSSSPQVLDQFAQIVSHPMGRPLRPLMGELLAGISPIQTPKIEPGL